MWYLVLAVSVYIGVYTVSYGIWEWKRSNRPAAIATWVLSLAAVAIPAVNIFM